MKIEIEYWEISLNCETLNFHLLSKEGLGVVC